MHRPSLILSALFAAAALSNPLPSASRIEQPAAEKCNGVSGPFLGPSFPDPSLAHLDKTWYSFGTFNGKDFQRGKSDSLGGGWSKLKGKTLAIEEAKWAGKDDGGRYGLWAPDLLMRSDGKHVMYFSALDKKTIGTKHVKHCIGAAISDKVDGVFHPVNDFVQCNRTASGVIDPAGFRDDDGKRYVVYKTEIPQNYLEIREVRASGPKEAVEWVGNAKKLLKVNGQGHSDGNNMEAPYIFKRGDTYFLTYSTHFTGDGTYDIEYATAKHVKGPYTRVKKPLLKTTNAFGCKIVGPGGASFLRDPQGDQKTVQMVFHGLTEKMDINQRVIYTATVQVDGDRLFIKKESSSCESAGA